MRTTRRRPSWAWTRNWKPSRTAPRRKPSRSTRRPNSRTSKSSKTTRSSILPTTRPTSRKPTRASSPRKAPDGEGETSLDGEDGGLAAVASQAAGIDLSEEGFHIVDGDEADEEAQLYENGSLDSYDADALNEDGDATAGSVSEVDEANALEELEDGQDDDVQDVAIIEPSAEDDGYELVELELDDDDIVRYIEDEDGDVIGFVLMEDGEEAEYYYVEEDEEEAEEEDNPYDLGITKEGVAEATNDMNAIYKDGIAVAAELKGAFDDIKSALDFTSF